MDELSLNLSKENILKMD